MNSKLILCLALILSGLLAGCSGARFKAIPNKQRLIATHHIVAEVTCLKATPRYYTTFRDRNLRMLAVSSPHVRWSATFRIDQVLKGKFSEPTITMVDAKDAQNPYSRFVFKTGKSYTVGFNQVENVKVKNLAVLGQEPVFPYGAADK